MTPKSQAKIKPQFPHIWFSGGYTQILFEFQYSKLMFWNVFFEGAIYLKFMVADWCGFCFTFLWIFMAAEYCGCWSIFFIKFFTTSKTFAILTCINTNLRRVKDCGLLWIKQIDGPDLCFKDQYEALQISRNNYWLPGKSW